MNRTSALLLSAAALTASLLVGRPAFATALDRAVVRFESAELGGPSQPRFIFERELAFEARIEALAEARRGFASSVAYDQRHVRAALERHVTEEILQSLPIDPPVGADDIRRRAISASLVLEQRVGGRDHLLAAATSEGMEVADLERLIARQASASLYLDRMIAPMLDPSDAELREVLRTETTPFGGQAFEAVSAVLRRWYVEDRLSAALASFFQDARGRIHMVVLARE
jgi:hypothetical protein